MKRRFVQIVVGIVLGLLVAETIFWIRDAGAFPHVNFYQTDAELGVRLMPGSSMRFQLPGDPVSQININSDGYRGKDFVAPSSGEILVVGDSQAFGLGVNDDETFSARLGELTKKTVINAGIPTYGPLEYLKLVEELAKTRKPRVVLFTVNFANDEFELSRGNVSRHSVWDGWAVESGTAPEKLLSFPGKRLLFAESHFVYAFRQLWYSLESRTQTPEQKQASRTFREEKLSDAHSFPSNPALPVAMAARSTVHDSARDILPCDGRGECIGQSVDQTAQRILAASSEALGIEMAIDDLQRNGSGFQEPSEFNPVLDRLRTLANTYGFTAIVLLLPLDIQVSMDEWKKYKTDKPVDMSPTLILLTDVANRATSRGIPSIDLTRALRDVEPGAFLAGDLHLTPKGHDAVARVVAASLKRRGLLEE